MLKFNYKNADSMIIGSDNGLNISEEFASYKETITKIIASLIREKTNPDNGCSG